MFVTTRPSKDTVTDPLAFCIDIARRAGSLLHERLDAPREIAEKSERDIVTDADRASEALIVEAIRTAFPAASILGEESGTYVGSGNERFVVDPLDGTTNYAHRYPLFCVSIAYEVDGVTDVGVVHAPVLGETFAARRGNGAMRNGRPMRVSATREISRALVCTGFAPAQYERNARSFDALARVAQAIRRDGTAALDLAFVAAGVFDAFWEWDLKPWDVAAGALLITEAQGTVTTIGGGPFQLGDPVLATNGLLHAGMDARLVLPR